MDFINFFKENILGWKVYGARVSSLFRDELILGSYLSRLMPIYFALLIYTNFEKKISTYVLFFLFIYLCDIATFLSGERVAFFFINASTLMLILTMRNYKLFRFFTVITSIAVIVLLINIYPKSSERIINKTITQLGFEQKQTDGKNTEIDTSIKSNELKQKKYIFSLEHQNHYISSFRMFKDNMITGIGPRMFRYTCGLKKYYIWEGCSTHPHNTYVQLLTETGLIGFTFGLLIFLTIFISILRHFILKFFKKRILFNDFQLALITAILISIWPFVPTGGLFNNWLNIIYFFPVGMYLSSIYRSKDNF